MFPHMLLIAAADFTHKYLELVALQLPQLQM